MYSIYEGTSLVDVYIIYERTIGCEKILISKCQGAMPRMQRSFWMLMRQLQFKEVCYRMTILTLFLVALPRSYWIWTLFFAWRNVPEWRKGPLTCSAPAGVSKLMQWWRNFKLSQASQESRGTKDELLLKACTGGRVGEKWQSKAFRHLICSQHHSCAKRARKSHSWANLYIIWRYDVLVDILRIYVIIIRICLHILCLQAGMTPALTDLKDSSREMLVTNVSTSWTNITTHSHSQLIDCTVELPAYNCKEVQQWICDWIQGSLLSGNAWTY